MTCDNIRMCGESVPNRDAGFGGTAMIVGSKATAVIRRSRPARNGTRVEATASVADAAGDRRPRDAAPRQALVPVEPTWRDAATVFVRLAPSAPFITQLATGHLGAGDGERRANRNPRGVAPRATGVYRAADRLSTEIEPGFLVKREF